MNTSWVHGTAAQASTWRAALDTARGIPFRGRDLQGNLKGPEEPGVGWTLAATETPVDGPGATAAFEIASEHEPHLGGPSLPPQASNVALSGLPPGLRTAAYARKGFDANGDPLPFP